MTPRHSHTLDSMWGVAAVAVVCMHASVFLALLAVPPALRAN